MSSDATVRALANVSKADEESRSRQKFKPFVFASDVMDSNPTLSKKGLVKSSRFLVSEDDSSMRLDHSRSLLQQGRVIRDTDPPAAELWANTILSLPS